MSDTPLDGPESAYVVTLRNAISIPERTEIFTCRDRSVGDTFTTFFGVDYAAGDYVVEVHNDNIRSVAHLTGDAITIDDRTYSSAESDTTDDTDT